MDAPTTASSLSGSRTGSSRVQHRSRLREGTDDDDDDDEDVRRPPRDPEGLRLWPRPLVEVPPQLVPALDAAERPAAGQAAADQDRRLRRQAHRVEERRRSVDTGDQDEGARRTIPGK